MPRNPPTRRRAPEGHAGAAAGTDHILDRTSGEYQALCDMRDGKPCTELADLLAGKPTIRDAPQGSC